jgi:hypothetical protein
MHFTDTPAMPYHEDPVQEDTPKPSEVSVGNLLVSHVIPSNPYTFTFHLEIVIIQARRFQ